MHRDEDALRDMNVVIELNADGAEAYLKRGGIYRDLGRFEESLQDYAKADFFKGDRNSLYTGRGLTYRNMGKFAEAIRDFTKGLESKATYVNYYNRGVSYLASGQANKGRADLSRGLRIVMKEIKEVSKAKTLAYETALFRLANGEVEEARSLYRSALEGDESIIVMLEAIRNLDQFILLFPNNQPAVEIRERLRAALGERQHGL